MSSEASSRCPHDGEALRPRCVTAFCKHHRNGEETTCALAKPAPAPLPLPEDVRVALDNVREANTRTAIRDELVLSDHIATQAQRMAEVEAKNGELVLALMDEQERTEHLSLRNLEALDRAIAAEADRDKVLAHIKALEEAIEQSKDASAAQVYLVLKHQLKETETARDKALERVQELEEAIRTGPPKGGMWEQF